MKPAAPGRTVLGVAEVVLWTRNMEESLAFYRDLFGLTLFSDPGFPAKFLKAGEGTDRIPQMVVLFPNPTPKEGPAVPPPGSSQPPVLHHLAFAVDPNRFDELRRRLADAGFDVRHGLHPILEGVRTFYVDDPDGNEVEVIAKDRRGRMRE
ncbi:MAG: VOC family protein [Actinomycetota bacterium]|nr:VOC family protein [Actinomycetota bacterium]